MELEEIQAGNVLLEAKNKMAEINNLPKDTQLKIAAKLLGYKKMPPDIRTFVTDKYYLGNVTKNLFPFWMEQLEETFPTPIHTRYPIQDITGGIGTGKSTYSKICREYMVCRLDHLIDPYATMGLIGGKRLVFNALMPTASSAYSEFIETTNEWRQQSPYFSSGMINGLEQYEFNVDGLRGKSQIGRDVIMYILSELNFLPYERAKEKLDTSLNRWASRFQQWFDYFGMFIIDTSSRYDDSIADEFANNNPYGDRVKVIRTNQWKVREGTNASFGRKGWFKVYTGDSIHSPFIVSDTEPLTPLHDKDRIIDVPEEMRPEFELNLDQALRDKAGISVTQTNKFIQQPEKISSRFCIPLTYKEVIDVDFFDKTDKLIYQLQEAVNTIPRDKIIFIHYDIGVVGDNAGVSIAYFDKWKDYGVDSNNKKMRLPMIKVPLAVGVSRKKEQETSIFKLQEFVIDLSDRFEIYFSADQFCSRQLLQNLTMVGIENSYISVDRTDVPYNYLKTLLTNGLIDLPMSKLLQTEICDLRRLGNKIDHPNSGCFPGFTLIKVYSLESNKLVTININELIQNYKKYLLINYSDQGVNLAFIKKVWETKKVTELIKLEFDDGSIYYCTPEHLILTTQGYIPAKDLSDINEIVNI